jgi:hypothetical protein
MDRVVFEGVGGVEGNELGESGRKTFRPLGAIEVDIRSA